MDIDSINARLDSLEFNRDQQANRIRLLEKMIDTRASSLWRRLIFRLDGWPSWPYVADKPAWRPWRKWWTS